MKPEVLFFVCFCSFAVTWGTAAILYVARVVPTVRKHRGMRTFGEAALQLNLAGHVREYGEIAREQNSAPMLRVYYILNGLMVIGVMIFLLGLASTFLPEVKHGG